MFTFVTLPVASIATHGYRLTTSSRKVGLALAVLLALGNPALQAGEKTKYGFAVSLDLPTNGLKSDTNDKIGAGAAFQVTFDLGAGHAIRPQFDVHVFQVAEYKQPGSDYRENTNLVNVGIGADYLYYFNGRTNKGLYAIGGLSFENWQVEFNTFDKSGNGTTNYTQRTTHRKSSLGGALGLGYQVNTWFGVEARYAYSQYEGTKGVPLAGSTSDSPSATRSGGATQLAATFRW
jgi:hypothetical protein